MRGNRHFIPEVYTTSPYALPPGYATVSYPVKIPKQDWEYKWPTVRFIILAISLIILSVTIISLEIANLAIDAHKFNQTSSFYIGTNKVAAGVWSGFISVLAGAFILSIVFVKNKRLAATFSLAIVALAILFILVLIGLVGHALRYYRQDPALVDMDSIQDRLLISMITIAGLNFFLFLGYIVLYVRIFHSKPKRVKARYGQ